MDIDVGMQIAQVERSVSSGERDGQPTRSVTISRGFATTLEDLWDAVTTRERIPNWFLGISGELELGGRYQLEGNAGGVITACERLSYFAVTWEYAEDISWVEVRFSVDGIGGARLALTHTALLSEQWDEFGPGAVGVGWELGFLGLMMHITNPTDPKLDENEFATTPEGKVFIAHSSEMWAQAAIDGGAEPDAAQAAQRRTTAFYSGESI